MWCVYRYRDGGAWVLCLWVVGSNESLSGGGGGIFKGRVCRAGGRVGV